MPAMRAADRSDRMGVARGCQPAADRSSNAPANQRRIASPLVAGNEQNQPLAPRDCALEAVVDGLPCRIKAVTVEVDDSVGLDAATGEAPVPA